MTLLITLCAIYLVGATAAVLLVIRLRQPTWVAVAAVWPAVAVVAVAATPFWLSELLYEWATGTKPRWIVRGNYNDDPVGPRPVPPAARPTNRKGTKAMTIKELQKAAHATAVSKGWWDTDRNVGEQIALMHSELSEALEEWRAGSTLNHVRVENGEPEGFSVELADVLIRIADTAERYNIDLEAALALKLAYNETRPFKHGGKLG